MAGGNPSPGGPSLGTATIRVIANTTEFDYRLRRSLRNLSIAAVGVGTALGALNFLGNSVKQAVQLETVFARIKTLMTSPADESFINPDRIREVSNLLGKSATEVAEAAYLALSSGVAAADVMDVITESGKNAIATNSDLTEAVNATTSALNAFGKGGLTAKESNDILFRSLQFGKGSMREFSRYISNAIPIVATLTDGSEKAFAQLSAMGAASTLTGKTARVAFTGLKVAMQELSDATQGGGLAFKEVFGEDFQTYVKRTDDLAGALVKFGQEVGGENLTNIFGAKEGAAAIQQLLSIPEKQLRRILSETQASAGVVGKAFQTVEETAAFQMQRVREQWKNLQSELGAALLPVVVQVMKGIGAAVEFVRPGLIKLQGWFREFAANVPGYVDWVQQKMKEFGEAVQPVVDSFVDTWQQSWPGLRDVLTSLWELLQSVGTVLRDDIGPAVGGFLIAINEVAQIAFPPMLAALQLTIDLAKGVVDNIDAIVAAMIPLAAGAAVLGVMTLVANFGSLSAAVTFAAWSIKYHLVATALPALRAALLAVRTSYIGAAIAATAFWVASFGPIGIIIAGIAAIIAVVVALYVKFEWFREGVDWILTNIVKMIVNVGQAMMNVFLAAFDLIISGAAKAFGWVPKVGDKLKAANAAFDGFAANANAALNSIQDSINIDLNVRTNIIPPGGSAPRPLQGPGLGHHGEDDLVKNINEKARAREEAEQAAKNLMDGFGAGLSSGAGGGLGSSGAASKAKEAADKMKALMQRVIEDLSELTRKTGLQTLDQLKSNFQRLGESLREAGLKRLIPMLERYRKKLVALAKQRDVIHEQLEVAKQNLQSLKDESITFQDTMRQNVIELGNVAQATRGVAQTFLGIRNQLRYAIKESAAFNANIDRLQAMGLNATSLRQLMEAGPAAAGEAARILAASGQAGINEINNLQAQLQKEADKLAQNGYDSFFRQGIAQAQGLVAGLLSQEKILIDKMTQIGKNMAKAFKKELGIKSPSRVFAEYGQMITRGLELGMDRGVPAVERAGSRLSSATTFAFGPGSVQVNGVADPKAAERAGMLAGHGFKSVVAKKRADQILEGIG